MRISFQIHKLDFLRQNLKPAKLEKIRKSVRRENFWFAEYI